MQQDTTEKVHYLSYNQLPQPAADKIAQGSIELGFASDQWYIQFQTITHLRQANRHCSSVFVNELLPLNYKQILTQVDNLRSSNSKEALILCTQIIEQQKIEKIECEIMRQFVAGMMPKAASQKTFIKNEAVKGLNLLTRKWNQGALEQLCAQTESPNGYISELSIKLLSEIIQNNKKFESNGKFLKNLSHSLQGKRSVLQKKARQILNNLKEREGEEKLQKKINASHQLLQQESNTLRRELKEKETKSKGPSFREFLKMKKQES